MIYNLFSTMPTRLPRRAWAWLAALVWLAITTAPAYAETTAVKATLIVRSLDDASFPLPPICEADCTLRDAIRTANASEGADIIEFAEGLSGEITLMSTLTITDDLTINGPGAADLLISVPGNDFNNRRAFSIAVNATVTIRGVTIQRTGTGSGGGINNNGNLAIEDSVIQDANYNGSGGGIYHGGSGALIVRNSTLHNNRGLQSGGIVVAGGTVTVINSTLSENRAGGVVNQGSAIRNNGNRLIVLDSTIRNSVNGPAVATVISGTTEISGTTFTANGVGALYVADPASTLMVTNSNFISNFQAIVNGVSDGQIGVGSGGTITVTGSTFTENYANNGGAILNQSGGTVTLLASTLTNNRATFLGGGAIYNAGAFFHVLDSTIADNQVGELAQEGGGIYNTRSGIFLLENSTVSGNRADLDSPQISNDSGRCGGISNNGTNSTLDAPASLTILNSTISGNRALRQGGGLCSTTISAPGTTVVTITHSTLTNNRVTEPEDEGDGGGGIFVSAGAVTMDGVILAGNFTGAGSALDNLAQHPDAPGTVTSGGSNLSDTPVAGFGANDQSDTPAQLGPLADNGGPTLTHALLAGSPAIDAATASDCPATDQRGIARPFDGDENGTAVCDIGAFELDGPPQPSEDQSIYLPSLTR